MSQFCPIYNRPVVYLTCLECEDKPCRNSSTEIDENANGNNTENTE